MRSWLIIALFSAVVALAQQQVVPPELDERQRKVYLKLTNAVSAPCCSNAIPVAYHESGMAIYIRNYIRDEILKGHSEAELVAKLSALKLGESGQTVIFAVPENNPLGWAIWLTPLLVVLLGALVIYLFYFVNKKRDRHVGGLNDDQLVETYREYITAQVKALE